MTAVPQNNSAQAERQAIPPGWYPDPMGGRGERYWDGIAWSEHFTRTAPAPAASAPGPVLPGQFGQPAAQSASVVPAGRVVVRAPKKSSFGAPLAALMAIGVVALAAYVTVIKPSAGLNDWQSSEGKEMHSSFVRGCEQTAMGRIDCECVFAKITANPPYDTPRGFLKIDDALARYRQTRNPSDIPRLFYDAAYACRR